MGKRIVNTAVSFGMAWQAVTGHLDTDVTVVRDAMEVRAIVVDNGAVRCSGQRRRKAAT